jgi:hypothetical protein
MRDLKVDKMQNWLLGTHWPPGLMNPLIALSMMNEEWKPIRWKYFILYIKIHFLLTENTMYF